MHISSLPSPYGIGTLGQAAYDFADFLKAAGQHYWQLLPIGPTSYGDSPYQSFSTHAGNPYFIDLDLLQEDGLLKQEEIDAVLQIQTPDAEWFAQRGVTGNYHGGGNVVFDETAILEWILSHSKR